MNNTTTCPPPPLFPSPSYKDNTCIEKLDASFVPEEVAAVGVTEKGSVGVGVAVGRGDTPPVVVVVLLMAAVVVVVEEGMGAVVEEDTSRRIKCRRCCCCCCCCWSMSTSAPGTAAMRRVSTRAPHTLQYSQGTSGSWV